jgi:hypothetical protein
VGIKAPSRILTISLGLHIGTFRKILLMTSARRFGIQVGKVINLHLSKEDEAGRRPQREILTPLEASQDHSLVTPPSHLTPQKAKGYVDTFTGNGGIITNKRILLWQLVVKAKFRGNLTIQK